MKKKIFLALLVVLTIHLISCKKSDSKTSAVENNAVTETSTGIVNTKSSKNESGEKKIDFDWTKMNYNMLSSLFFDVQINPENYNNKRFKLSGNFHTSIYEGKRYYSVLVWDPTGCCPTGLDFIPPADMKYPEDFPEMDTKISITCVFKYSENDNQVYFSFVAEEVVLEDK